MSERDGYEPGAPCWVSAVEPDPDAAAEFYTRLFGWEAENLMPDEAEGDYYVCRLRGREVAAIVSYHGAPAPPAAVWSTHVSVASADAAAERVRQAGGTVIGEPFDSPGAGRMAVVADPAGAVLCLWQPQERKGAQRVNEPSAWSMSLLRTGDPEGAKCFYRSVFGWESEPFGDMTLWRLPGYAGGEPQQPVPRDVVAVMAPIGSDEPQAPVWGVDFWIADADAAARRAEELGGSVLVAPHDVPGFRHTVVTDPQGAAFSLSQLVLPAAAG
jgi:predicted enzyme related to lactoylglutathione lyase